MGIPVACCRMLHSDRATGYDPAPLDLWFESNRAYQIFPSNLLLDKISMKSA